MTQIMSPSNSMTAGQINKAVANYRALLEKYSGEFNAESVQVVLGQSELAGEQLAVFRRRVEAVSNLIIRRVNVDRAQSPQDILNATEYKQYADQEVVDSMPKGECDEVVFFNVGRFISDDELEKEYELRGFKPADPYSLIVVNRDDPTFADEHPNCTHWKDAEGRWCFATFVLWLVGREVDVDRRDRDWGDLWWFAGVRK